MRKSLPVILSLWICVASSPTRVSDEIRGILSHSSPELSSKTPDLELAKDVTNSELVSLVNDIIRSLSQNGTLTEEGSVKLREMVGHYSRHHGQNFTVDGHPTDDKTGTDALMSFLQKLKLKDADFDYTIVKSVHNEIDVEEEEEETDDPQAKDQIVVDYIKNIDKTIAVEGEDPDSEANDKQLKELFQIMAF